MSGSERRSVPLPGDTRPAPQPEHDEPRLRDPGPHQLSRRDLAAIAVRAARESVDDNVPALASAVAYRAFLAVPAVGLVTLGAFGIFADPGYADRLAARSLDTAPPEVVDLVSLVLRRLAEDSGGSLVAVAVGLVVAAWAILGSMTTLMWALNVTYERTETRSFLRQRVVALTIFLFTALAVALTFGLLALGPVASGWVGAWTGEEDLVGRLWWLAQWPLQLVGLSVAFAGVLYLGPNVEHPRWEFVTPGSVFAVVSWLAVSGAFAVYVGVFDGYDAAWGPLAAVIVLLVWLWLSSLSLLVGAELNAEAERSRELRTGLPAERQIQAPPKA
jgi:membrane protein